MYSPHPLLQSRFWIFDLDGTLTRPLHDFAAIRRQLEIPEGAGILEYIAAQPPSDRERLHQALSRIERQVARQASANPGALALLQYLQARDCRLGIVTRNQRECVAIALERIGAAGVFDPKAIIACDDAPPKPHPAGIQQIFDYWGARPEQCVMVGDFRYDLELGRAAGTWTVHYSADREERWPELTDLTVERLADLMLPSAAARPQ